MMLWNVRGSPLEVSYRCAQASYICSVLSSCHLFTMSYYDFGHFLCGCKSYLCGTKHNCKYKNNRKACHRQYVRAQSMRRTVRWGAQYAMDSTLGRKGVKSSARSSLGGALHIPQEGQQSFMTVWIKLIKRTKLPDITVVLQILL